MSQNKSQERAPIDWDAVRERLRANQTALESLFSSRAAKNKLVFQERAEQMAARVRKSAESDIISVTTFQLGKERYCLPTVDLKEIIPFAQCTPIPGAPAELKGVVSVRSDLRCVVDLAAVLGLNEDPIEDKRGYILLLRSETFPVGLKVKSVHQVQSIERATIDNQDGATSNLGNRFSKGVEANSLILLNLNNVLAHPVFRDLV
ncbi:MAG: chemotaxis protein CheW [Oligoflexus sp.]|nr:chemotaxis protein CheW [Oligoflexus sp.]